MPGPPPGDLPNLWMEPVSPELAGGFSRQEHWSGSPCLPPGDLPDTGLELVSPALAGGFFTTELPGKLPDGLEQ